MAKKWAKFPYADKAYVHDAAGLKKHWARLHKGDCEPLPKDAGALDAWAAFHAGDFARAVEAGLAAGGSGINAAVKAQVVYGHYLEKSDKAKLALFEEAAAWADARRAEAPKDAERPLLPRVRARPLQPGHLGRQGARAGARREDQGVAARRDQAAAEARRRPHRLRRLPGRGDRQGGRASSPA